MSVELTLNLLLGLTVLGSLAGARMTSRVISAIKTEFGTPAALYLVFSGFATAALWIALAIQTDHWQFAALTVVPFLIRTAANLGSKS